MTQYFIIHLTTIMFYFLAQYKCGTLQLTVNLKDGIVWSVEFPSACCNKPTSFGSCRRLCIWDYYFIIRIGTNSIIYSTKSYDESTYHIFDYEQTRQIDGISKGSKYTIRIDGYGGEAFFISNQFDVSFDPLTRPNDQIYTLLAAYSSFNLRATSTCVQSYGNNCYKNCIAEKQTCNSDGTMSCKSDYFGDDCEFEKKFCDDSLCLNAAACSLPLKLPSSACICPFGINGKFCETFDYSIPNICGIHGSLEYASGKSFCKCSDGYEGKLCSPTCRNYCLNDGVCSLTKNIPSCNCVYGKKGSRCELNMCTYSCYNGGDCDSSTSLCRCTDGWTGEMCTQKNCEPTKCLGTCNGKICTCGDPHQFGILCSLVSSIKDYCVTGQEQVTLTNRKVTAQCPCSSEKYGLRCQFLIGIIDYCNGHGKLVSSTSNTRGYDCACSADWSGPNCLTLDFVSDCKNGVRLGNECICDLGYSGPSCDIAICDDYNCINGNCVKNVCICKPNYYGSECSKLHCNSLCQSGTCNNSTNMCQCEREYSGDYCELHTCEKDSCKNNGKCISFKGSLYCFCSSGFRGTRCEIAYDVCSEKPCKNNGTCSFRNNEIFCSCNIGYSGRRCEITSVDCSHKYFPCENDGTCLKSPGLSSLKCLCEVGYAGPFCQYPNHCRTMKCENDGICVQLSEVALCECVGSFGGTHCEITLNAASYIKIEGGRLYAILILIGVSIVIAGAYIFRAIIPKKDIIVSKIAPGDSNTLGKQTIITQNEGTYEDLCVNNDYDQFKTETYNTKRQQERPHLSEEGEPTEFTNETSSKIRNPYEDENKKPKGRVAKTYEYNFENAADYIEGNFEE